MAMVNFKTIIILAFCGGNFTSRVRDQDKGSRKEDKDRKKDKGLRIEV
jgi:hypothetical protein